MSENGQPSQPIRRLAVTLRELEVLRALVETGTATAAARRLGLTQPAISRAVAEFEATLGRVLFDRSGGRLVPTTDCLVLNAEIGPIFAAIERLVQPDDLDGPRDSHSGRLHVGAPPTIAHRFMPPLVARFTKANPALEVVFDVLASDALITSVAEGRIDIALTDSTPAHEGVRSEIVLATEAVCALPSRHRLAARALIRPPDLEGEPFIALTRRHSGRIAIDRVFERAGMSPKLVLEAATAVSGAEFVAEGLGVALLNPFPIARQVGRGVALRPFQPSIPYRTVLLTPSSRPPSPAAADFAAMIRTELAERYGALASTDRK